MSLPAADSVCWVDEPVTGVFSNGGRFSIAADVCKLSLIIEECVELPPAAGVTPWAEVSILLDNNGLKVFSVLLSLTESIKG